MNLPNKLTISRIILACIFILLLFIKGAGAKFAAFSVFLVACATDYYDGLIARKTHTITDFGKLMDPIADKILILGAFLAFVEMGIVHAWMVIVIIARESVITGLRMLALSKKKVISAETAGKQKTVSQIVAVVSILIFLIIRDSGLTFRHMELCQKIVQLLMLITVFMTLISGVSFLLKNRHIFIGRER